MASVNNRKPVDIQHQTLDGEQSKSKKYLNKIIRWTGRSVKSMSDSVFKLLDVKVNKPLYFLKRKGGRPYTLGAGGYAKVELARQGHQLKAVKILYDNPEASRREQAAYLYQKFAALRQKGLISESEYEGALNQVEPLLLTQKGAEEELQMAQRFNSRYIARTSQVDGYLVSPLHGQSLRMMILPKKREVRGELQPNPLPEKLTRELFKQMLLGVKAVHREGYAHRRAAEQEVHPFHWINSSSI